MHTNHSADLAHSLPPPNCHIRIRGELDPRWADYIGEFSLTDVDEPNGRVTNLDGFVRDQSALLGVLLYLNQFGLPLLSIEWA